MTDSSQETRIKEYAKLLNNKIEDGDLLDFVTLEVKDRVLVYLNDEVLDTKINFTLWKRFLHKFNIKKYFKCYSTKT